MNFRRTTRATRTIGKSNEVQCWVDTEVGYVSENQLVAVMDSVGEVLSSRVSLYFAWMNRLRKRLEYDWVPDTEEERPGGVGKHSAARPPPVSG